MLLASILFKPYISYINLLEPALYKQCVCVSISRLNGKGFSLLLKTKNIQGDCETYVEIGDLAYGCIDILEISATRWRSMTCSVGGVACHLQIAAHNYNNRTPCYRPTYS